MSMDPAVSSPAAPAAVAPAAGWVRRRWCVALAAALVLLGTVLNTVYLFNHCPIDLSGDEAHYWEWSRHLDYGYYSKPPGIAWVIAAALRVGGAVGVTGDGSGQALAPVMRMASVVMGIFSGLLSLLLARRMFRDDRAALAVIVLSAAAPMFAVGSLLITIDAPMYLCWAATVYCLWRAVESSGQGAVVSGQNGGAGGLSTAGIFWLYAAGVACAAGMLFKPVLIAVPACAAVAAWADPRLRRTFRTWHAAGAAAVVLLSQAPVVVWNAGHGWVTVRHMLTQGGLGRQAGVPAKTAWYDPIARVGEFLGGQAGGMGGILFVLLVIAVIVGFQRVRQGTPPRPAEAEGGGAPSRHTVYAFLLSFTLPLWLFYFVMNLWKKTEPNWPAASYFTGMILLAGVFVDCWHSAVPRERKAWRVWGTVTVAWGVVLTALAMNMHRLYPVVERQLAPKAGTEAYFKSYLHPTKWDQPMIRLRGADETAAVVERVRQEMRARTGQEPLLISGRYDTSSSLAFYLPGHPFVYCIMSSVGGRRNQYDFWPGLNARDAGGHLVHAGRPAVIVGSFDRGSVKDVLQAAFDRLEGPERFPLVINGITVKDVVIYRGYGFRELPETGATAY